MIKVTSAQLTPGREMGDGIAASGAGVGRDPITLWGIVTSDPHGWPQTTVSDPRVAPTPGREG